MKYDHLIGRPFLYGVRDCYALVRDVYRDSFGIELTDYARPQNWRADTVDLLNMLYDRDGFRMITDWRADDLRPGDVLAMAIQESNPNHLAVYVGDNTIAHHLWGQLSKAETFRDFHRHATCFIARHRQVPDLRPALPQASLGDILRDRYRVQPAG